MRAFRSVGGTPRFLVDAKGAHVIDAEGVDYLDFVASWGPAILGHSDPDVVKAVQDAAARGLSFGASTPAETELAELVKERVAGVDAEGEPVHPVEKLRLVSTGTEATMTAVRLARGFTGRDLIVKFAGHYHGHSDGLLADAGSGVATLALPGSAGIPAEIAAQTIVIDYNDISLVREVFAKYPGRIAAIITESVPCNMGVVLPKPGFNHAVSRICKENGALYIVDEVLAGFRAGPAGWWGVENSYSVADVVLGLDSGHGGSGEWITSESDLRNDAYAGDWTPDLMTFGKVIGGGMPVAALGGRADVMDYLAPEGPVYQAGTLSGNPVAVAAGLTTLQRADDEVYEKLNRAADRTIELVSKALTDAGVPFVVQRAGTLFSFQFGSQQECGWSGPMPRTYADTKAQQAWRYPPFFHSLLDQGVSLPPSVFEGWFVTAKHDDEALDRLEKALPAAARAAAEATPPAE